MTPDTTDGLLCLLMVAFTLGPVAYELYVILRKSDTPKGDGN